MDLVRNAGLDVSDWAKFKGGASRAAANPKYCYEWAFVQEGKAVVLNIWHDSLHLRKGTLVVDLDMRRHAERHAAGKAKGVWLRRATRLDAAAQTAFTHGLPVRVILLDGLRRSWRDPNPKASRVDRRILDPVPWAVIDYDPKTGRGTLKRGISPRRVSARTSYFAEIRTRLRELAADVSTKLASDPWASGLNLVDRNRLRIGDDTGGYYAELGELRRGVAAEMWLDHFSGLSTPRLWVGFGSASRENITSLLSFGPLSTLRKGLIRPSGDIIAKGSYAHLDPPLRPEQFGALVQEDYAQRHYLGVYSPTAWPFSGRDRRLLVADASRFISSVSAALMPESRGVTESHRALGPWTRPDPRSEKAAIRHVTRHLRASGYSVKSKERVMCGYDLEGTRGGNVLRVEVKGCKGSMARFFISRNELNRGEDDPTWRLVVVTNALTAPPRPRFLRYGEVESLFDLQPTQWQGQLRKRGLSTR